MRVRLHQLVQRTCARIEAIGLQAQLLQDAGVKVVQWNASDIFCGQDMMLAMIHSAARQQDWHVRVRVRTAVGESRPDQRDRVIEKRAAVEGIFGCFQFLKEGG